jgi:UMF1 family MFS transporter
MSTAAKDPAPPRHGQVIAWAFWDWGSAADNVAPGGQEGQLFGLYATTGRAVSFLAPTLFGVFTTIFGAPRAGIIGILLVLVAGLAALLPVRAPAAAGVPA